MSLDAPGSSRAAPATAILGQPDAMRQESWRSRRSISGGGRQEAGAEALSLWRGDMAGTCDEASRPACGSLAGASACSCP
jgi:hypothetical protein